MRTLINLFEESVKRFPDHNYLMDKYGDAYEGFTFTQVRDKIYHFAAGLMSLGIQKGDRLALLCEGRHEWVVCEMGILYAGAVNVPLSVKLTPDEILFRIRHAECKIFITSSQQVKKMDGMKLEIEHAIIVGDKPSNPLFDLTYADILRKGEQYLSAHRDEFEKRCRNISENDLANICYTSGTTADPKGIMLLHKNYYANVEQALYLFPLPEKYCTLLILPWDHAFAHTCVVYTLMRCGGCVASVKVGATPMDTLKNIPVNIKDVRPDLLTSVPALAKNFRKNIESGIRSSGRMAEILFSWGMAVGRTYNGNGYNTGKGLRMLLKPIYKLFDVILFKKVRAAFGGKMNYFVGGGALLDIELQYFFAAIGLPMLQGYGLTEASPIISANTLTKHKFGSSGILANNMELKICDDKGNSLPVGEKGEIVIRGDNVMAGYWKNPEATAETIKDGWLFTGDLGSMDKDGFLYVFGRFKSLLIADDGEKYSPEGLEEAFVGHSPYIEQCMLYNNQDPYTVALIVPNKEAIRRYLKHAGIDPASDNALIESLKLIDLELKEYRTGKKYGEMFPQRWIPAAFAVIDEPFTEENNLLNSTLKMVRGKITETYHDRIRYLYTSEAKEINNIHNIKSMQRLFSK